MTRSMRSIAAFWRSISCAASRRASWSVISTPAPIEHSFVIVGGGCDIHLREGGTSDG